MSALSSTKKTAEISSCHLDDSIPSKEFLQKVTDRKNVQLFFHCLYI